MKTTATMTVHRETEAEGDAEITLEISGDYVGGFSGDNETPPEDACIDDIIAINEDTGEEVTLSEDDYDRAHEILMDTVE